MTSSSDDESIFITQNTFVKNVVDTDIEENLENFLDNFDTTHNVSQMIKLSECNNNDMFSDDDENLLVEATQQAERSCNASGSKYSPEVEDISEDESTSGHPSRFNIVTNATAESNAKKK